MQRQTRRGFMTRLGSGMLVSAVGVGVADELDLFSEILARGGDRLDFGDLEPLVSLMQETEADALLPRLKAQLDRGTTLDTLVAASALANARTFGGQDYTGYHCFMALVPALAMARRLEGHRSALPVFKVLHRNARRIQESGGRRKEVLRPVQPAGGIDGAADRILLEAGRTGDFDGAEAKLGRLVADQGPRTAYRMLQPLVRDNIDVHQVVLAFRSWDMLRLTGESNAHVMLRQTMRQCIDRDSNRRRRGRPAPSIRTLLPRLMEAHRLDREVPSSRRLDDGQLVELARVFFDTDRDAAAKHTAAALAEGVSRQDIGEALSLASVRLLLHDPGRSSASPGKPVGSVHGASIGVHAADSANAWRGIAAQIDDGPTASACLITAAWHTAGQSRGFDPDQPFHARSEDPARNVPTKDLLAALDEAVQGGDQAAAAALAERYGRLGGRPELLLDRLIEPAIRNDGALHHEKFFLTAAEEFARTRPSFRWEHLVALTRVMASGTGFAAPGLSASEKLLGV